MIIVFQEENIIKLLIPNDSKISIIKIGEKCIDFNIPFWVINIKDLPDTPQETWKLENMGDPSGYGKRK